MVVISIVIVVIIIVVTITIYYYVRSSDNVMGKAAKFTFLDLHLQPKHEEGVSVNSRQRQMLLNSSL